MTDVLIIGAGPSGAVAGALLAQKGYDVLILERQVFPRFSIGESLLANSLQLLEEAGMHEAVMRHGFQFKNGAAFVCDELYSEFNFVDKVTPGSPFTFQVQRADFDQILANEAARLGAKIRYQVEITAIDVSGERPVVTAKSADGSIETHRPRFVLDGSGFGRTLPRLLDLEKRSIPGARGTVLPHQGQHRVRRLRSAEDSHRHQPTGSRCMVLADSLLQRHQLAGRRGDEGTSRQVQRRSRGASVGHAQGRTEVV